MAKKKKSKKDKNATKSKGTELKREELSIWKQKLSVSNKKYEDLVKKKRKRYIDYYLGKQRRTNRIVNEFADTVVNMVFSNISTILPSIIFRNPRIYITPKRKPTEKLDTVSGAAVLETVLNYFYKELDIKSETRRVVLDALIGPWGLIHLGYNAQIETVTVGDQVSEAIKEENPFAIRIAPEDLRVDSTGKDHLLKDAKWIAFRWVKTLKEVQDNPDYKNTDLLKNNTREEVEFKPIAENPFDTDNKDYDDVWGRVEGWEIWDKENQRVITLVLSQQPDQIIQDIEWPIEFEGFPLEVIFFNENPDSQFPLSDVETYIQQQDELNEVRSLQMQQLRNNAKRKYITKRDSLDDANKRKIMHGPDGTVAETDANLDNVLKPVEFKSVSQDAYIIERGLKTEIRELAGVSNFERGIAAKVDSATEASLINQGITVLREYRQGIVEDFTIRVMKKLSQILQQTLTSRDIRLGKEQEDALKDIVPDKIDRIVRDGAVLQRWLNADKDSIKGEYFFDMQVGSMLPTNKETRKKDMVELTQILQGNPFINPEEGTKRILDAYEVRDIEKLMIPAKQVQQQQEQGQQKAVQAEIAKDTPKRQADLEKTKMKTQSASEITSKKNSTAINVELIKQLGTMLSSKEKPKGEKK